MKKKLIIIALFSCIFASAQKVTVTGRAIDTSNGLNAIEIVINDTLAKIMKDPKEGRPRYLRMYQDPRYVVRTDSTGNYSIRANLNDTLYFKSYRHVPQARRVKDLVENPQIIKLIAE